MAEPVSAALGGLSNTIRDISRTGLARQQLDIQRQQVEGQQDLALQQLGLQGQMQTAEIGFLEQKQINDQQKFQVEADQMDRRLAVAEEGNRIQLMSTTVDAESALLMLHKRDPERAKGISKWMDISAFPSGRMPLSMFTELVKSDDRNLAIQQAKEEAQGRDDTSLLEGIMKSQTNRDEARLAAGLPPNEIPVGLRTQITFQNIRNPEVRDKYSTSLIKNTKIFNREFEKRVNKKTGKTLRQEIESIKDPNDRLAAIQKLEDRVQTASILQSAFDAGIISESVLSAALRGETPPPEGGGTTGAVFGPQEEPAADPNTEQIKQNAKESLTRTFDGRIPDGFHTVQIGGRNITVGVEDGKVVRIGGISPGEVAGRALRSITPDAVEREGAALGTAIFGREGREILQRGFGLR